MDRPTRLDVSIGGYFGTSYQVGLDGSAIAYRSLERGETLTDERLEPTERQWSDLRGALDSADIWGWAPEYYDPGIVDGTSWSLEIAWGEQAIRTHGSNAFPESFDQLLAAVSQLVGGRAFR